MEQATAKRRDVPQKRDIVRRLAVLGSCARQSRGDRFLRRGSGASLSFHPMPTLADAVNLPDWILADNTIMERIATVTVLLHYRPVIDQIVDGERLRAICGQLGEDALDLACAAAKPPVPLTISPSASLPPVDDMMRIGRDMLERALPKSMAERYSTACGDADMRDLSNIATALVVAAQGADAEGRE